MDLKGRGQACVGVPSGKEAALGGDEEGVLIFIPFNVL